MNKYIKVIILGTVSLFASNSMAETESSSCYDNIPNSPEGSYVSYDVPEVTSYGVTGNDSINLKFWRKTCLKRSKSITEMYVTVTPTVLGKNGNYNEIYIVQGNLQERDNIIALDNLYSPTSFKLFDSYGSVDLTDAFKIILACENSFACGVESISLDMPAMSGGSSSSTTMQTTSGLWYDPSLSGLGFNFVDASVGLFAYYYGYDISGNPLWLYSSDFVKGDIEKGKSYTLNLFKPTSGNGANFNTKPNTANSGTSSWGTMTVKFNNCNSGVVTLNGDDGVQVFNISKLAGVAGTACN